MKTVLSHANLIDCGEPKIRPDSAVLIEDGRIRAILLPSAPAQIDEEAVAPGCPCASGGALIYKGIHREGARILPRSGRGLRCEGLAQL